MTRLVETDDAVTLLYEDTPFIIRWGFRIDDPFVTQEVMGASHPDFDPTPPVSPVLFCFYKNQFKEFASAFEKFIALYRKYHSE